MEHIDHSSQNRFLTDQAFASAGIARDFLCKRGLPKVKGLFMEGSLNTDHSAVASIAVCPCLQKLPNTIEVETR